jgi:hypothetical protein
MATVAGAVLQSEAAEGPAGFSARGNLVVTTEISGAKLHVGGNIALEERGSSVRLDVLSIGFPGTDPTLSALASSQLFPSGGYTVVLNRADRTYTVWSPSKRIYFTSQPGAQPPASNPAVAAATTVGSSNDMLHAFSAARPLRDYRVFSASLNLTGHGTTNGHPTTGLAFALKRQERTGSLMDVHGTLELADDLDEVPVQLTASVNGAGGAPPSSLRLDLTSIDRDTPPDADFSVPANYTRAERVTDVFGRLP